MPDSQVTVVDVKWHGSAALEPTYKGPTGKPGNELLYRDREPTLEIVSVGRPWSFDGDGALVPVYLQRPFQTGPDFAAESVTYKIRELLEGATGLQPVRV